MENLRWFGSNPKGLENGDGFKIMTENQFESMNTISPRGFYSQFEGSQILLWI